MADFDIVLASASPRRRELLEEAGVKFIVRTPQTPVDEKLSAEELADPYNAVKKLAERKSGAVVQELLAELSEALERAKAGAGAAKADAAKAGAATPGADGPDTFPSALHLRPVIVIGADTMVVKGDKIFGKPRSASDATHMLRELSGCTHQVMTGVCVWALLPTDDGNVSAGFRSFTEESQVRFRDLSDEEIAAYLKTGESFDKAGAYAIQGGAAKFVVSVMGALDTVIGLPVGKLLREFPDLVGERDE